MNVRKKTWTRSVFSQLSMVECTTVPKPTKQQRISNESLKKNEEERLPPAANSASADPVMPINWIDNFAPCSTDELAVHHKKVSELQDWLKHCEVMRRKQPAQFCLLTGPTGSGKTAVVRVLAEQCQYQLQEWINPVDSEVLTTLGDQSSEGCYIASQVEAFKSFLFRASRYKSLFDKYNKRLLLVEDFPNSLISDAAAFESILENYVQYGMSPLVFIVADSKSRCLNISYNLFSEEVKNKFRICHVSFNPIASTFMQKAVKRFCALMRQDANISAYKVPAQSILDSIVVSAQGDIRNALINLHFAALKGGPSMGTIQATVKTGKTVGNKKRQHTLKSIGRDESITMLHALGRALNPKYCEDNETKLMHSPEDLSETFSTEPKKFVDFLHANYLPHFTDIGQVLVAADALTYTDVLLTEYREHTLALIGLNLGVRAIMVANRTPMSGWMPVRGPKRLGTSKMTPQTRILNGENYVSTALYATDYSTYINRIAPKSTEPCTDVAIEC